MSNDGGLRPLFRKNLPYYDWQSIETAMTGSGVPDSNFCSEGVEGWIENKQMSGWKVPLRPDQIGWITRRCRYGGRVFIAARRRHHGGIRLGDSVDELWLLRGEYARELRVDGLRKCPPDAIVGRWSGGPQAWPWLEISRMLLEPRVFRDVRPVDRSSVAHML